MTQLAPATVPPNLTDNEQLPIGLALTGDNPANLSIKSAVWTGDAVLALTPSADTLTATGVTTTGSLGNANIGVEATMSDGSILKATAVVPVGVVVPPSAPLTLVIVFGTPAPRGA